MIINKLIMSNFCQHRDREEELGPGMIGVVGKNGNGKTNLIRAILFALSGDAGGAGKKEDDVTKGETGGSVRAEFVIGDKSGFVKRDLKTSRAHLKFGDLEEYKSSKEVDRAIYGIMGISSKLLREVVFVGQGCIENMLFERPAERAKAFSALFGTDSMERIRELLLNELTTVQVVSNVEALEQARNEMVSIESQLFYAEAALKQVNTQVLSEDEFKRENDLISAHNVYTHAMSRYCEMKSAFKERQDQYQKTFVLLNSARDMCVKNKELLGEFRESYELSKGRLKNVESMRSVDLRRQMLKQVVEKHVYRLSLPSPGVWTSEDEAEVIMYKDIIDRLCEPVKVASRVIASLGTSVVTCPTCLQPVPKEFVEKQISILNREGETFKAASRDYENKIRLKAAREKEVIKDIQEREVTKAQLEAVSGELMQLGEAQPVSASIENDGVLVEEFESLDSKCRLQEVEVASLEGRLNALREEVEASSSEIQLAESNMPPCVSDQDVLEVGKRLKQHSEAQSQALGFKFQMSAFKDRLTAVRDRIVQMEMDEEKMVKRLRWRKLCEDARMILHRDRLPNRVAQAYLGAINSKMNEYLEVFQSRYSCSINPDLSVKCHFGEHEMVAERLSGGQRVELGLAFRFALYDLFVGHLGLLVIDEPTAWLDDDHIEAVVRVLERVKVHSKSKGMQVIIPTHEPRLMPAFDRVIQI